MKNLIQNKFKDLRKSIISVLSSNAFKAAIFLLLSLALFACSSDTPTEKSNEITDTEVNNPSQKPETPEVPDNSETPDTPETPDDPNTPTIPDTPEEPEGPGEPSEDPTEPGEEDPAPVEITAEMRVEALKNIFGITDLTGGISSDINLTAQTIKVIGDISSDSISKEDIKSASENKTETLKALREKYGIILSGENVDVKNAIAYYVANPSFITRNTEDYELDEYRKANNADYFEGDDDLFKLNYTPIGTDDIYKKGDKDNKVPYYQIENNSGKTLKLTGDFHYDDLHIKATGINVDDATFTIKDNKRHLFSPEAIFNLYKDLNGGANINYVEDILKKENKTSNYVFPKIDLYIFDENYDNKSIDILTLIDLYVQNSKADNIKFRNIPYQANNTSFDGNPNKEKTILFDKDVENSNIPNVSIDTILKVRDTHSNILKFKNLKITGSSTTESEDINSTFTNVIFEGDVSGIKNSADDQFNGVVYFKDMPYNTTASENNPNADSPINGLLKLDVLTNNINYDNFKIIGGGENSVIDLRNIDINSLNGYNVSNPIIQGGGIRGSYYPSNISEEAEKINKKFADEGYGGFIHNSYSGEAKIYTYVCSQNSIYASSKTPRTLEEFEYFGNNGKFEKSAYETYENNFKGLTDQEKQQLEADKDEKLIANNNKIKPRAAYI